MKCLLYLNRSIDTLLLYLIINISENETVTDEQPGNQAVTETSEPDENLGNQTVTKISEPDENLGNQTVTEKPEPTGSEKPKAPKEGNTGVIIGSVVGVLAFLGIGYYAWKQKLLQKIC